MTKRKILIRVTACCMLLAVLLTNVFSIGLSASETVSHGEAPYLNLFNGSLETNRNDYLDGSVMYRLPETVSKTDAVSVIITTDTETLLEAYGSSGEGMSFSEFSDTFTAGRVIKNIEKANATLIEKLDSLDIEYKIGEKYETLLAGFEIEILGADYETVYKALSSEADVILGDAYEKCDTELVENTVNVYETGIFNSKEFAEKYGIDGSGMVIAVLDTGLDYTHSAFDPAKMEGVDLGLTLSEVQALVGSTAASDIYAGLSAEDVYLNAKVPYSFDYADKDPDVFPIQSDHGTHVSGIILGDNDVITGVAPKAQLASMKIFSDTQTTARTSWILGALEDCVVLGVDVINLSIGTSCGFSHETEKEMVGNVYQNIRDAGISLIVAASNSYNSTYGSEKNGNLGLTSNPDSATVGSPSTYKGALSIASISGKKTPYLLFGDKIIYFTESSDRFSEEKNFVEEILKDGQDSVTLEYVKIPGAGRSSDYMGIEVAGKIALIERGSTTFEEKVNTAEKQGAIGVIIYNNVSGEIKMNVGATNIAACSIRQDAGKMLAEKDSGTISISRSQTSGPFMSDFSSWGPNPDLEIKPELTAHGGSILSSVPGEAYDRISGTSMATPNVSGLAALLRQYVKENFTDISDDPVEITKLVNQLFMSTADIVYNTNGLPYSVRKQGAGLANLSNSVATDVYIITHKDGVEMDKSKIELGDDPEKNGVYELSFSVKNFGTASRTFDISAYVMTEGVSDTKTHDGKTTVTEQGRLLDGARIEITKAEGATRQGSMITVDGGVTASVTVKITLSASDRSYLDSSFANGMYIEGFVVLDSPDATTVDLSVPFLGFYGDWTKAPIFDLDYFETNKDEIDDSIDTLDKTLPDAYASRPIGGTELDYVSFLGSYYFEQNPNNTLIAADRKYISLSNQTDAVNSLRFVWAGLLRNAAKIEINITDDSTGEVVYSRTNYDIRKSYGDGGSIYPANVEIEFSAIENNLKNNTQYTVTLKSFLDYGDGGADTNVKNTFSFPLYIDFEAPTLTGCEFYTEYDRSAKKNRLYAKIAVYDNHYSMSMQIGNVGYAEDGSYLLDMFDRYMTPVYSEANSVSYVVYELTDHIDEIKKSAHKNTFTVVCYDYALNQAAYEIALPDEYTDVYFEDAEYSEDYPYGLLTMSPNEVKNLTPMVYPETEWGEFVEYRITGNSKDTVTILNNQIVALKPGTAYVTVYEHSTNGPTGEISGKPICRLTVKVLAEGDKGYKRYDRPTVQQFDLTGYYVDKAFYFLSSDQREIGMQGDVMKFADSQNLSMYPSEAVTLRHELHAFFPDEITITYKSSSSAATVDQNGKITAQREGSATITVAVMVNGKSVSSESVRITVKDPFVTTGPILTAYYGNGGVVTFDKNLAINEIGQYAFSNFDYIPKGPGDEISEEEPDLTKIWYLGEDTITKVIIPASVERIGMYAFAGLTSLEEIEFEAGSRITTIDVGAFYGCTSLTKVTGIENVKFFNQYAFLNTSITGVLDLREAVAIGDGAFARMPELCYRYNKDTEQMEKAADSQAAVTKIILSDKTQSIGAYAFWGCTGIKEAVIEADKVKLGQCAFSGCTSLSSIRINASVIPAGVFEDCSGLTEVTIGRDVETIGEHAFAGTKISSFTVEDGNGTYKTVADKPYLLSSDGTTLLLVAPELPYTKDGNVISCTLELDSTVTAIAPGALSGNKYVSSIVAVGVTSVGDYAMADCRNLKSVTLGTLTKVGKYSFFNTSINTIPDISGAAHVGDYAFAYTALESVSISDGVTVGEGAFAECKDLKSVTIGDGVKLGYGAFMRSRDGRDNYVVISRDDDDNPMLTIRYYVYVSDLKTLVIGKDVTVGDCAFMGAAELTSVTIGDGAIIGNMAFYNCSMLKDMDLSGIVSIGDDAFSGDVLYMMDGSGSALTNTDGSYRYSYHGPVFTEIDLSSLTDTEIDGETVSALGSGAFAYLKNLTKVTLGSGVTVIPERAFLDSSKLTDINLDNVVAIGDYAFEGCAFTSLSLPNVQTVGSYAFVYIDTLGEVTFGDNTAAEIGEGAFAYCSALRTVNGFKNVSNIGNYSFAYTAITEADLSGAYHVGEGAFIKDKSDIVNFKVTLGENIESFGDNPFAFCRLSPFSTEVKDNWNGTDKNEKVLYTFDLSDTVKVVDGILYRKVASGLELVCYAGSSPEVNVAEGTVRISALAFAGAPVSKVTLPYTLNSIGHKAFYGCEDLMMVSFASYSAPILEEEYDESYFYTYENLPASGEYEFTLSDGSLIKFPGLAIVDYYMWNASSYPSNVYYGASFIDYIGHITSPAVMVYPVNGVGYDSFIYSQYFNVKIEGAAAADDVTLEAIEAINRLPDRVSLADKPLVEAARAAYNKIATLTQQSLVTVYSKLTAAEKRIINLENLAGGSTEPEPPVEDDPTEPTPPTVEPPKKETNVAAIILGVTTALFAGASATLGILYFRKRKTDAPSACKDLE
ncbi:MAG: leucine-rich repeat protein [Clostridia bacterium]|nr:leucine-rich repeat protein [Clostridia bacterium]